MSFPSPPRTRARRRWWSSIVVWSVLFGAVLVLPARAALTPAVQDIGAGWHSAGQRDQLDQADTVVLAQPRWGRRDGLEQDSWWYQRIVDIEPSDVPLAVSLGPTMGGYELFAEGVSVAKGGRTPENDHCGPLRTRVHKLPPDVDDDGRVVLTLHTRLPRGGPPHHPPRILDGPVLFGPATDVEARASAHDLAEMWRTLPGPLAVGMLILWAGLIRLPRALGPQGRTDRWLVLSWVPLGLWSMRAPIAHLGLVDAWFESYAHASLMDLTLVAGNVWANRVVGNTRVPGPQRITSGLLVGLAVLRILAPS